MTTERWGGFGALLFGLAGAALCLWTDVINPAFSDGAKLTLVFSAAMFGVMAYVGVLTIRDRPSVGSDR